MSFLLLGESSMPVVLVSVWTEKPVSNNNIPVTVRHNYGFWPVSTRIQGSGKNEMPKNATAS
jgi:hypothetical protein